MNAPDLLLRNGYASRDMRFFSVYDEARGSDDDAIIQKAFAENWILITNYVMWGRVLNLVIL